MSFLIKALKAAINGAFKTVGYEIRHRPRPGEFDYQRAFAEQSLEMKTIDFDRAFLQIVDEVRTYTMTSIERMFCLYKSVEYIVKARVPGDMLECGVWQGGSMMLVARTLLGLGDISRTLYLFDTFEGHPKPDDKEDIDLYGNRVVDEWAKYSKTNETSSWAYAPIDKVWANMMSTGYPEHKIVLVKGMVEKTAERAPGLLSLVRLDTDWYSSAKVGLETFWPRLARKGILIVDDYGHYPSQKKAVDEYFASAPVMLHRVDYSGRAIIKTD